MKFISALFLSLFALIASAAPQNTAVGHWKTFDDNGNPEGEVIIYEEDGLYAGKIGRSLAPDDNSGPKYCNNCPGDLKGKPLEGLRFMWDFKRNGDNYRNGEILDPDTGDVYSANMRIEDDGETLLLRGYAGIPLFGRTETWKRMSADEIKTSDKAKKEPAKKDDKKAETPAQ